MTPKGTFHGVGLGPGNPDLLTVQAVKLVESAGLLTYFAKKGRRGNARTIVDKWVPKGKPELPLWYPMTTETHFGEEVYITALKDFYERSVEGIADVLDMGKDVVLVCEGDPMFYGSFMHLYVRLKDRYPTKITPGVTGMAGCWAAAGLAMTWGDDQLSVLAGTLDEDELVRRLEATDAAVIMKLGSNFAKVRKAIERAGMLARATYVERGTMAGEVVMPLADKDESPAPYFSLILIPGEGRRP